ncbi:MAG: M3 family oligoendopeptidase, partial [Oscillospiraceae bacterium]|nr:M3 family oligoendopeptidase [Oscillospiraceae bacterium]
MKFNEMEYIHLDVEKLREEICGIVEKFKAAKTFTDADNAFAQYGRLADMVETQTALAYIRHTVNTLDEFYDKEQEFLDENLPVLTEYFQMMTSALLESPFRAEFTEKYGSLMFINEEMELKTFSPEIVADLQEENKLTTEYEKLLASAQIEFNGKICTVPQLLPYKQCADDEMRLKAWTAEGNFYKENKAELDRLFDNLVRVRDKIARKLGFDGFTDLGYYRMRRNSYTKEDVAKFRTAVQKYLVSLADKIYRETAERIG